MSKPAAVAIVLSVFLAICCGSAAADPQSYPGCAAWSAPGRDWYVSPLADDINGDGSRAHPWSLGSIFSSGPWGGPRLSSYSDLRGARADSGKPTNPAGLVHPGDTILFLSGVYPPLTFNIPQGHNRENNWLTLKPAANAAVILTDIRIRDRTTKLRVSGFIIRNANPIQTPLIEIQGSATDIMIDNNDIAVVEDDVSQAWTKAEQWEDNIKHSGIRLNGRDGVRCITIADNKIHNTNESILLGAVQEIMVHSNELYYSNRDFIDLGGNNIALTHNFMHDTEITSSSHQDCIQGFGPSWDGSPEQYANGAFAHIVIDGNTCIRRLSAGNRFARYIQGIDAFDSDWTDVQITRNVVVTSACWGLSWGSTHFGLFAHNTIVFDGTSGGQAGGCEPQFAPFTTTHSHNKGSDHVVAINNIVPTANFVAEGDRKDLDGGRNWAGGNLVFKGPITFWSASKNKIIYIKDSGVWDGNRLLSTEAPRDVLMELGRNIEGRGPFDLRLSQHSPALDGGVTAAEALNELRSRFPNLVLPAKDIEGKPYGVKFREAGAYAAGAAP